MNNILNFKVPFSGYSGTTFINCFASTYMFLENIAVGGSDYECKQLEGKACDSCCNCSKGGYTSISKQECYFFLFDTMCGRSSLRCRFDGSLTEMEKMISDINFYDGGSDNNVDFLFGFVGYDYRQSTDIAAFKTEIAASIGEGKPVIAKVKSGDDRFRVIIGCDADTLLCPDFTNAQNKPQSVLQYDEIDTLYIIGGKIAPRYTVTDGLKRIKQVMDYNISENLWGGYCEKMGLYTSDSLSRCSLEEKQARMKRVAETMWHTFNCHNFAEVFRKYRDGGDASAYEAIGDMKKLRDPRFTELWNLIGGSYYGYTHDLAWALIGLEACADWTQHATGYFGGMVELTIRQIAKNDEMVLDAINKVIEVLES